MRLDPPIDALARAKNQHGVVIIPACNEAAVIMRTLEPLSGAVVRGRFDVIVVCNGCVDNTAELANSVPGIQVLEIKHSSKALALNAGDAATSLWPRLYLDADIQISPDTVLSVFDRLLPGDVLAARPQSTHDLEFASRMVRSYYRTRDRVMRGTTSMWGAGAYALSEQGHERLGTFPPVLSDDLLVDRLFSDNEKTVVDTSPVIVTVPRDLNSLAAILRRSRRGELELSKIGVTTRGSLSTVLLVLRTIRGPKSAFDALVYFGIALLRRQRVGNGTRWERDDSSRQS